MKHIDSITFSSKELKRLLIIRKVINRSLTQKEAAHTLSLSTRQIRRMVRRVKTEGIRGIVHKLKENPSNRGYSELTKHRVIKLFQEKYNHLSISETARRLSEVDRITVHRETLRLWLVRSGCWENNGKKKKSNVNDMVKDKGIRKGNKATSQKITVKDKRDGNSPQKSAKTDKDPEKLKVKDHRTSPTRKYIPPSNHPWRRLIYPQYADKYRRDG